MRRSASGIWTDARFSLHLSVDVSVLALRSQMPPWLPAALGFVMIGGKAITPLLLVQKKKEGGLGLAQFESRDTPRPNHCFWVRLYCDWSTPAMVPLS